MSLTFIDLLLLFAGYCFAVFSALCYAAGLCYVSELCEEYPTKSKKAITYIIYTIVGFHLFLWIFSRFPFWPVAVGICSHGAYFLLLKVRTFPDVNATNKWLILSLLFLILNNYSWYLYLFDPFALELWLNGIQIGCFYFLMVWLVPLAFLCCLSLGESSLPFAVTSVEVAEQTLKTSSESSKNNNMKAARNKPFRFNLASFIRSFRKSSSLLPTTIIAEQHQQAESPNQVKPFSSGDIPQYSPSTAAPVSQFPQSPLSPSDDSELFSRTRKNI